MIKTFKVIFIWTCYFFTMALVLKIFFADVNYAFSQKSTLVLYEKKLESAVEAIDLNPNEPAYYVGKAKIILTSPYYGNIPDSFEKFEVLSLLKHAQELNKSNLVTLSNSISLYAYLAKSDPTSNFSSNNIDLDYIEYARSFYSILKYDYSTDVGILVKIANYEKKLGLEKEYLETIDMINLLRPGLLDWYVLD